MENIVVINGKVSTVTFLMGQGRGIRVELGIHLDLS